MLKRELRALSCNFARRRFQCSQSNQEDCMPTSLELWERYKKHLCVCPSIGLTLDISRMNFGDGFLAEMSPRMNRAFAEMDKLEGGSIANPDENRMVGHYWLRDAGRAPAPELRESIAATIRNVR